MPIDSMGWTHLPQLAAFQADGATGFLALGKLSLSDENPDTIQKDYKI